MFPTNIRSTATAFVMVTSKLLASFSPQMILIFERLGFHVLSVAAIPSVVAFGITFLMPETLGVEMQ